MDGSTFSVCTKLIVLRAKRAQQIIMKKLIIVFALLIAGTVSFAQKNHNPFAFGVNVAYNFNKAGAGLKFAYDFTKMCRFTFEGNYYFYNAGFGQTVYDATGGSSWDYYDHLISSNTRTYTVFGGRQFDFNANLNIVFGEKDFHFYLITGLAYAYGRPALNGVFSEHGHQDEVTGEDLGIGIDSDEVYHVFGIGLNLGCGVEYQITESVRANFEQALDISIPNLTAWNAKLGVAYCF